MHLWQQVYWLMRSSDRDYSRMGKTNYNQMTDEQLIRMQRSGDKKIMDYIMEKYKYLVRKEANAMYLLGGENDDLIQEGMIGLFKAVQDYDPEQIGRASCRERV